MADDNTRLVVLRLVADAQGFTSVEESAQKTLEIQSKLNKETDTWRRRLDHARDVAAKMQGMFTTTLSTITKIGAAIGATGLGFEKGAGELLKYNKNLLTLNTQFAKYGTGIRDLEKKIESVGKRLSLTRAETMEMFSAFERGFSYASLSSAEKIMTNIRNVVGSNAEAMKGMMQTVSQLTNMYPDLLGSVERMDEADKKRLKTNISLMVATGKISVQQAKALGEYVGQSDKISTLDDKRKQDAQNHLESVQRMKKLFEEVSLKIGQAILPLMKQIADFLTKHTDSIAKIGGFIAKWVIPLTIVAKTLGGIGGAIRGVGSIVGSVGGALGVGGKAGILAAAASKLGGKGGGLVSSVLGNMASSAAKGTPVYVTNFPSGLSGGPPLPGVSGSGGVTDILGNFLGKGKAGGIGGAVKMGLGSRLVGGGLLGAAGALVGMAGEGVSGWGDSLAAKGHKRTGAAVGLGGDALGVLGGGLSGAGLGLMVGGPVGAAVGAAIGVIVTGVSKLPGMLKKLGIATGIKSIEEAGKKLENVYKNISRGLGEVWKSIKAGFDKFINWFKNTAFGKFLTNAAETAGKALQKVGGFLYDISIFGVIGRMGEEARKKEAEAGKAEAERRKKKAEQKEAIDIGGRELTRSAVFSGRAGDIRSIIDSRKEAAKRGEEALPEAEVEGEGKIKFKDLQKKVESQMKEIEETRKKMRESGDEDIRKAAEDDAEVFKEMYKEQGEAAGESQHEIFLARKNSHDEFMKAHDKELQAIKENGEVAEKYENNLLAAMEELNQVIDAQAAKAQALSSIMGTMSDMSVKYGIGGKAAIESQIQSVKEAKSAEMDLLETKISNIKGFMELADKEDAESKEKALSMLKKAQEIEAEEQLKTGALTEEKYKDRLEQIKKQGTEVLANGAKQREYATKLASAENQRISGLQQILDLGTKQLENQKRITAAVEAEFQARLGMINTMSQEAAMFGLMNKKEIEDALQGAEEKSQRFKKNLREEMDLTNKAEEFYRSNREKTLDIIQGKAKPATKEEERYADVTSKSLRTEFAQKENVEIGKIDEAAFQRWVANRRKEGQIDAEITSSMASNRDRINQQTSSATMQLIKTRKEGYSALVQREKEMADLSAQEIQSKRRLAEATMTGTGVSAELVRAEFEAKQQKVVAIGKEQMVVQERINEAKARGVEGEKELMFWLQRSKQLNVEKLNTIAEQAELTKQLRDGWVNAIGAMTVGSGRITKITMDQAKNTGLAVENLEKMKVTAISGAMGQGYKGSERFTTQAWEIAGKHVEPPFKTWIESDIPKMGNKMQETIKKSFEAGASEGIENAIKKTQAAAAHGAGGPVGGIGGTGSGTASALGATLVGGGETTKVTKENMPGRSSPSPTPININLSFSDKFSDDVEKAIRDSSEAIGEIIGKKLAPLMVLRLPQSGT